ncbi:hypothetical protein GCM10023147_26260 [Tsukamurella soli]|uniref:DUF4926 domain-containing protein n=1 Tax=Tsukamurella soli TaxID=644556 RepID=A0ABP8JQX6_9ACTN
MRDLPADGLTAGTLGTIVHVYDDHTFEVEFVTAGGGRTLAVTTVDAADLRPHTE